MLLHLTAWTLSLTFLINATPALHFGTSANDESERCQSTLTSLHTKFPALTSCFPSATLYFSTPSNVCPEKCLSVTIEASKAISANCEAKGHEDTPGFLPADVYNNWANEEAARAACSVPNDGRSYCLNRLETAMLHAQMEKLGMGIKGNAKELLGCHEKCLRDYYKAVNGAGEKAPVLYYFGGAMVADIFTSWKQHCDW